MKSITSSAAPQAVWPYSQAIESWNFLFLSGQIALDPKTMNIVGETTSEQAEQICKNIAAVLYEAWLSFDQVVKTTLFLTVIDDFTSVNEVYARYFVSRPARSTIAVSALPKWAMVEIECVAERK